MTLFLQQLVNGLSLGSLYGLIAIGYTMVYGIVQLINFAHGEIFMIGRSGRWRPGPALPREHALWVLPLMLVGAVIASTVTAVLTERFAYRPLRNAPRLAPLITAIGVSIFLQEAVGNFYPDAKSKLPFPQIAVVTGPAIQVGGLTIQRAAIFTVLALVVCSVLLWYFVNRTKPAAPCSLCPRTRTPPGSWASTSTGSSSSRSSSAPSSPPSPAWPKGCRTATSTSGWASSPA